MGTGPAAPLAHLSPDGRRHLLHEHLLEVAERASRFGAAFDGAGHAQLAGLWHDLGKYSSAFQQMLAEANQPSEAHVDDAVEQGRPGRVDHSTAGALHAGSASGSDGLPIAFAIAGHHAGLADWKKLAERLRTRGPACLEAAESGEPPPSLLRHEAPPLPARVVPSALLQEDPFRSTTHATSHHRRDALFVKKDAPQDRSTEEQRGMS